ncbi:hypothetical protein J3R82DRAFT_5461 [Butyriboletus roseoflavus]|nr:hypothetical protein J3R82DRAFT_5461 [Butyriboletus roseoflavus]
MPALLDVDVEDLVLSRNFIPLSELVYEYNATLPTLLQDHHLRVHVARYKSGLPIPGFSRYFTGFKVDGHRVELFDIPARNGALHVLSTILDPRKGYDHRGGDGETERGRQGCMGRLGGMAPSVGYGELSLATGRA